MAVKANKGKTESFITYKVVKAHDGLNKGEILRRKAGDRSAEYCVSLGLWKRIEEE
jgi:hypothetical protein